MVHPRRRAHRLAVSVVYADDDTVTAELMDAVTDLPCLVRLRLTDGSRVTA